jgi:hypothetical protein
MTRRPFRASVNFAVLHREMASYEFLRCGQELRPIRRARPFSFLVVVFLGQSVRQAKLLFQGLALSRLALRVRAILPRLVRDWGPWCSPFRLGTQRPSPTRCGAELYQLAVTELDPAKLQQRVADARNGTAPQVGQRTDSAGFFLVFMVLHDPEPLTRSMVNSEQTCLVSGSSAALLQVRL